MIARLLVSCLLVSQGASMPGVMTAAQFLARLEALESALTTAAPRDAGALAARCSGDAKIEANGEVYDVDLEWAGVPLRAAAADPRRWPSARDNVVAGIERERREMRAALSAHDVDRAGAHTTLGVVLRNRQFSSARAFDWRAELWREVSRRVRRLWNDSLGQRVGARTIAEWVSWTIVALSMIALGMWLVHVNRRRRRETPSSIGRVGAAGPRGRELALEAEALVHAGRIRDAIRAAYRAAVQRLEEEGAWHADAARTPREYLSLLPAAHRRRSVLASLTRVFERVWYGSRPVSAADGAEILRYLTELECLPRDHAA